MSLVWFWCKLRRNILNRKDMVAVLAGSQPNAYPRIIPEVLSGTQVVSIPFNKVSASYKVDIRDIRNWFGVPTVILDTKTFVSLPQETLEAGSEVVSPQDLDAYWVSIQNLGISLEAEKKKPDFLKENLPLFAFLAALGALAFGFLAFQSSAGVGNQVANLHTVLSPLLNANASAGVVIKPI